MSLIVMEGRRFKADHIPLATTELSRHAANAARGSQRLRDAILLAKGIVPLPLKGKPLPLFRAAPKRAEPCMLCGAPVKPRLLIAHIQETVSAYYGVHPDALMSSQRGHRIAHPRQIAMFLSAELTRHSLMEIGRRFKRDHTTVIHAIKVVGKRMYADADMLMDVEVLRERLAG